MITRRRSITWAGLLLGLVVLGPMVRAEKELPVPEPESLKDFRNDPPPEGQKVRFTLSREDFLKILAEAKPVDPELFRKTERKVVAALLDLPPEVEVVDFGAKFSCKGTVKGADKDYTWHLTTPNTFTLRLGAQQVAYLLFSFDVGPGRAMKAALKGGR